jgi:hypothetical protein
VLPGKIRPIDIAHHELAIRGLIEHEIREPLFTAGPDQQIRIGNAGRIEVRRDQLVVDALGVEPAAAHVVCNRPHGTFELAARTVIHRQIQDQTGIRGRTFLQIVKRLARALRQRLPVADDAHADVVALQFGQLALGKVDAQIEEERDLLRVAPPVLGREAVDRHDLDSEIARCLRYAP